MSPIPKPGFGMAGVVLDGKLHVLGGSLGRLPEVRCCATSGVIDGKLYVAGGFYHDIGQTCAEMWGYPFSAKKR